MYLYVFICVCVFLLSDLSRSLFLLAFTTEKKMAARYVRWNKRRSSAEREGTRGTCGRTIDNRHEARTSGNNGKFDERIDACIVYRSIAIVCRKQYLSLFLILSRGDTRIILSSARFYIEFIINANTISAISLAGSIFTLVKHVSILPLLCKSFLNSLFTLYFHLFFFSFFSLYILQILP